MHYTQDKISQLTNLIQKKITGLFFSSPIPKLEKLPHEITVKEETKFKTVPLTSTIRPNAQATRQTRKSFN